MSRTCAPAAEAGAKFGVSPGLNPDVVRAALELGFTFAPGVMTPSDVEKGMSMGLRVLKFFPAGAAGGPRFFESSCGALRPYRHQVRTHRAGLMPTIWKKYLSQPVCIAAGGTWIAKKDEISGGKWDEIAAKAKAASEAVKKIRS